MELKNDLNLRCRLKHLIVTKKYVMLAFLLFIVTVSVQSGVISDEDGTCAELCNLTTRAKIQLRWVDNLAGDFSFKDNWSYPEGIYRNKFGQLSCDGFCPSEIENMFDDNGRILEDSLDAFYNLVDTTHLFHSIESDAVTYEWSGTNFISVKQLHKDTVICSTADNAGTHSRLNLVIIGDTVEPTIELNSIASFGNNIYYCSRGEMTIDKGLWEQGVLKATFDFIFDDKENPDMQMYWKGNIYAKIQKTISHAQLK